ncbi:MAG: hypothetical protein C4532_12955 [Candidatus Abyssobacteria bacterium SURF_17]|uniref:Uncharacterized protein n=1 Tax=Candidatus Abyssobacteria bacterium SURF_17 TaxID=2093361 RepID=A0A419EVD8_9BACT|nr:MAG: hypothetical protein C4532_12955 [Candidatus Abyssubacteria bacterium SURF_17]
MHAEDDGGLTPEFLKRQLQAMAEMSISERTMEKFGLFVGLVATMNALQPEGYSDTVPPLTFQPVNELAIS